MAEASASLGGNWTPGGGADAGTGTTSATGDNTSGDNTNNNKVYVSYKSKIKSIDKEKGEITTEDDFNKNSYLGSLEYDQDIIDETTQYGQSEGWAIDYNSMDSRNLNVLLNVRGNKSVIVNSSIDAETTKLDPYSVVLKTYEPLQRGVFTKDKVNVVKEMIQPVKDTIRLVPFNDADLGDRYLYQPNDKSPDYIDNLRTSNKTQEDLLTSDNYLSGSLFNEIISGSNQADINVDYNDYDNFSTFGSIRKRLENFWTKMERYEYYSKESGSLAVKAVTTASVFDSEIVKNEELKNGIVNNFDHFEKYLFFESSSANSSSFGLEFDTSWPKENSTKPHNVLSVTSSAVSTWYNNNIISASNYDQNNPNRLINLIPEYIKRDDNTITYTQTDTASFESSLLTYSGSIGGATLSNQRDDVSNKPFLDFLDMTGHYFDNILVYIKAFEDIYNRRENLDKGLSKDLVWTVSNAFGWRQPSGKEIIDLHRYFKGQFLSGSVYDTYSVETEKDLEREIWNRVLTSMPYILKTKGTKESIQALVNTYGIPPSILRINEYGGPDNLDYQPTFDIQQRFTKALDFRGSHTSSYILSQWKEASGSLRTPDTIEFRFRTPSSSNQVLLAKDGDFAIRLLDEGSATDNKGKVEFVISSSLTGSIFGTESVTSSLFPVFNNEFWSVGVTRESSSVYDVISDRTGEYNTTSSIKYNLYVKQYESGRSKILYDSATSMTLSGSTTAAGLTSSYMNGQWTSSGNLYWGSTGSFGDMGVEFTGSLQELRLWNAPLTESAFDNHTRAPKAINGNHASASFTDLIYRLRLDENRSLASESDLRNITPDQTTFAATSSAFQTGSAVGFTANTYVNVEQEEKRLTPNIGLNRKTNTKVRIEKNWIPTGSFLSPDHRSEVGSFDTMPLDSNKVGVFFSPTDVVNQDIIESLADLNFEQEIGDPRDQKKLFYRGLKKLADSYFQKYSGTNNFWDYMRLVKYYDQAIFEQIKKVIPARVNFNFGLLVEPTILERSKNIIGKTPSIENISKTGEINVGLLEATQSWRRPVISVTSSYTDYTGILSESFNREPSVYLIGSASLSSSLDDYRYINTKVRTKEVYYLTSSISERNYDITLTPGLSSSVIYEPDILFNEAIMPYYSSSREHPILKEREIFYTSGSARGAGIGATSIRIDLAPLSSSLYHAYSSSLKPAEVQLPSDYLSAFRRSGFEGVKNTIDTTIDGGLPIEVKASQGTAVVTRAEGSGKKLEVVRKK